MSKQGGERSQSTRRTYLKGCSAVVGGIALAGCSGGQSTSAEATSPTPIAAGEYPLVERWLGTDEVGGTDDTYDGTIRDSRGVDSPTVVVGAEGNGGPVSYSPSALLVTPGTVVRWEWTAHGHHNVAADPDAQLGESAVSFTSGDPVEQENNIYTELFEQPGTVLYHCGPHLGLGMKGAVVVAPSDG